MKLVHTLIPLALLTLGCALGGDAKDDDDARDGTDPTDDPSGGDDTADTDEPDDEPTTGPGVLGDETGLEAQCRRFFECGGTWYEDEEDCIQASYDYWGDCPQVVAALDALGACVAEVECSEYNPDSYRPSSVGCGDEWDDLNAAECR